MAEIPLPVWCHGETTSTQASTQRMDYDNDEHNPESKHDATQSLAVTKAHERSLRARLGDFSRAQFFTVKPSELQVQSLLGSGAQADVFKAEWTRSFAACSSTIVVALKRLHSEAPPNFRDREALTIMTDHPNLLKCFDCTQDPPYLVVCEYCAGGSLFDLLYNTKQELSLKQLVKMLVDVSSAMAYLHALIPCVLHRDLKSSNVLLTKSIRSRHQEPFVKVADFGLARTAGDRRSSLTAGVGTWRWMAPEVFQSSTSNVHYDERADVFSFAMLMYELLARKLPYIEQYAGDGIPDPRIGLHVCLGLRPCLDHLTPECPQALVDMMQKSWSNEPEERLTFSELHKDLEQILANLPYDEREDSEFQP